MGALPMAWDHWQTTGEKPSWIVSLEYRPIFEGVSYVNPISFRGHYSHLGEAITKARAFASRIEVPQLYGLDTDHLTDSFETEAWRVVGRLNDWAKLPLVIDRRNLGREALIWAQIPATKPWILVAMDGKSSPFPYRVQLMALLSRFRDSYHLVNLCELPCSHPQDLLGIFERAAVLISIDTMHLHLANATPKLPVVSLVSDSPTTWHGSARRAAHRIRVPYSKFLDSLDDIEAVLNKKRLESRLFHVWSDYKREAQAEERHGLAADTWEREYQSGNWLSVPIGNGDLKRNSALIGDKRGVPFVKDMIDLVLKSCNPWDWIVLTNDDCIFARGLTETILCLQREAAYAHRHDFGALYSPLPNWSISQGRKYPGNDLFAFTKRWWTENQKSCPDMLLGSEAWDLIFRTLMQENGAQELHHACYHQVHPTYWSVHPENMANRHNLALAITFMDKRHLSMTHFR